MDPGLYMKEKSDVFWITQRRSVPTAFKLFTGLLWHFFDDAEFFSLLMFASFGNFDIDNMEYGPNQLKLKKV